MKLLLSTILMLSAAPLFSQAIEWQSRYGGAEPDRITAIHQTADGGYIAIGFSYSLEGDITNHHGTIQSPDVWVIKLNGQGILQWQKSYGGSNEDYGRDILQTPDGDYVFVSSTNSIDGDITHLLGGGYNTWLVKLNATGNIEWENTFNSGSLPRKIVRLGNGNIVVAGTSGTQYWICQIDATGESKIWERVYGGNDTENLYSMAQTADKGFILTGSSFSNSGDVTGHHGPVVPNVPFSTEDYWVVKVDSLGHLKWQKSLGGTNNDRSSGVIATSDGGSLVCGFTQSNNGDVIALHTPPSPTQQDAWVVKLNAMGNIMWQKCLGGSGKDYLDKIFETTEGNFVVAGVTESTDGDVDAGQYHGAGDSWIVTLNPQGNILSQRLIGGSLSELLLGMTPCSDGGILIGGHSNSNDGDVSSAPLTPGNEDFWFVKMGTTSAANEPEVGILQIYPNPGAGILQLVSTENDPVIYLSLTNALGNTVYEQYHQPGTFLDLSFVPAGIYLVNGITKSGKKQVSKWAKQ